MLVTKLKHDFQIDNDKGFFIQLVHDGWNQVNVLKSPKGSNRGGHYHKENKEAFYIITGKVKLLLEIDGKKEVYEFQEGDFFMVKPYQKHIFEFLEETIMVSMYDLGVEHEDGTKDIYND